MYSNFLPFLPGAKLLKLNTYKKCFHTKKKRLRWHHHQKYQQIALESQEVKLNINGMDSTPIISAGLEPVLNHTEKYV